MAASKLLNQVRQEIRRRNYSFKTEQAYINWIKRYIRFYDTTHPIKMGAAEVERFLNYLANEGNVSSSTQNQALSALVFLYKQVFHLPTLQLDDLQRAKKPLRVPMVLVTEEIRQILSHVYGLPHLILSLMYGTGMRISEVLRLRITDVDFQHFYIVVRSGKGLKDRRVMLPNSCLSPLKDQVKRATQKHENDCGQGLGEALLPKALAKKYPGDSKKLGWQYVFFSDKISKDPRSGLKHRHHISDRYIQKALKKAVSKTTITKKVTSHTLRHSFATQMLQSGYDIRTVQELLGHSNVKTTMIYTHVLNREGNYLKSPVDVL